MMKPDCSLDHGFASYIGVLITKTLSGILDIDERQKTITIHSAPILIDASFVIPLRCGTIRCGRQTADGRSTLRITYPKCYQIRDSSADSEETMTRVICEPVECCKVVKISPGHFPATWVNPVNVTGN